MEKPRVLFVGTYLSRFVGTRALSEDLIDKFSEKGWEIISASNHRNILLRLFDMVWTTWSKRFDYDIACVDVFSGRAFYWAKLISVLLRSLGKPYILVLRGGRLPEFAHRWPGRVRRLLQSADFVNTPSNYLRDSLRSFRDDIHYIPNALEISRYHYCLRSQPSPNLIWLRALHAIYAPQMALEVVDILKNEIPDLQLTIVGPDKKDGTAEDIHNLVQALNISNRITIVGQVEKQEVPQWLSAHDIFLNTTRFESFGVSVMEAAATGLCIVSTNVGELQYLWKDGRDALLVPQDDASAMAAAIRRILNEPDLATRLSRSAHQKAEFYDWSNILLKWEDLFRQVIEYA